MHIVSIRYTYLESAFPWCLLCMIKENEETGLIRREIAGKNREVREEKERSRWIPLQAPCERHLPEQYLFYHRNWSYGVRLIVGYLSREVKPRRKKEDDYAMADRRASSWSSTWLRARTECDYLVLITKALSRKGRRKATGLGEEKLSTKRTLNALTRAREYEILCVFIYTGIRCVSNLARKSRFEFAFDLSWVTVDWFLAGSEKKPRDCSSADN